MNKMKVSIILFFLSTVYCNGQIVLTENFESTSIPIDWQISTNATDNGWRFGTSQLLSSQFFEIESNGSLIAATNDDSCNCDKSNEYLISEPIDLTDVSAAVLKFDLFYTDQAYQGFQEDASIEISIDGVNWVLLDNLHGHGGWDQHLINISDYIGNQTVYIGFKYDDNGGWLYGMAIDNVIVEVPNTLDASLVELESKAFGEIYEEFPLSGTVLNNGSDKITTMEIQYTIEGESPVTELFENLDISAFSYSDIVFNDIWIPQSEGEYSITVEILKVNNNEDEVYENNSSSFVTTIYGEVDVPNKIEQILGSVPEITTIGTGANGLDRPTDLEFFPVLGKDELWVINQRTESEGGSTVTISDATKDEPNNYQMRVDGNSWHFMSLPTGIAFSSENFNFANSTGVQDANHNGGTFTGPALWSSDPSIYAQPSGGNGSHLDMLHGSPYCMGIAHEIDNVFWVYDDWNKDIVRYDFGNDHGPGNDNHADGKIRRYKNIGIQKDADIPGHMILDKSTGWLYFIDNGNSRVIRLDINSGNIGNTLPEINEPLAEHVSMIGFETEVVVDQGLERPSGIEFFDNYLLVGNYGNGAINVYDTDNDFEMIGTIETGAPGLTGITIGPDGNIYAVNRINNTLISISEGNITSTANYINDKRISVYPNPSVNQITIEIGGERTINESTITILDMQGHVKWKQNSQGKETIDVSGFTSGIYVLKVKDNQETYSSKFSIINK